MTNIPLARAILETALANAYRDDQWRKAAHEALGLMTRRSVPRRKVTSARMTPELAERARLLHKTTDMNQRQIGDRLNVHPGRVSEAIKGLR